MKKIKWLFGLCLIVLVVCGSGGSVQAADGEIDTSVFEYEENEDGTINITRYTGTDETVVIPSEIDGKDVKVIGGAAFGKCDTIKHLIISKGITCILDVEFLDDGFYGTFECCKNLQTVSLPSTLETIGDNAFFKCYNLNVINVPDGLIAIGENAFYGCDSIEKLIIPNSVTYIGENAFSLSYDERIPICGNPDSYAKTYADADPYMKFSCVKHSNIITDIAVAPTCTEYGNTEGSHCADCGTIITESKSIQPNGHKIITVDKKATCTESSKHYTYCEVCGKRDIDENGNNIPSSSAIGGTGHKFDNGIVTIQPSCLSTGTKTYTCTVCGETRTEKIPKISIPRKGKMISDSSNSYKVAKSVKSGNTNATGIVEYVGTNSSKTDIIIPNTVTIDGITYNVTSVANNAFKNNKKLKKITIGSNITNIKIGAFNGCKNLKTIIVKSKKIDSVGKNAFKGINAKAKIKVPSSRLSKYKKIFAGKGQRSTVKIKK